MAEHRDLARRGEQERADREVGGVPEVLLAVAQHVLRRDGEKSADHEGPQRATLRLGEQGEADAADVGALQVDDAAAVEPGERRFRRHAHAEREHEARVAAEHVIAELRDDQDERDEPGDQVARVDPAGAPPEPRDGIRRCSGQPGRRRRRRASRRSHGQTLPSPSSRARGRFERRVQRLRKPARS